MLFKEDYRDPHAPSRYTRVSRYSSDRYEAESLNRRYKGRYISLTRPVYAVLDRQGRYILRYEAENVVPPYGTEEK